VMTNLARTAPFPAFGGKRSIADQIWPRLGSPKQYIEPFCFSAAVLLAAPSPAALEVIGDTNGFVANFWRAVVHQAEAVARWADYPVSHVDLGARHVWLMAQRERLAVELQDPDWPGDAKCAGWWLWGQCAWIGSGWCEWVGKIPRASDAGVGIQAIGQIPAHHIGGVQSPIRRPDNGEGMWTSCGRTAFRWLTALAARLERVRVVHGSWERCLNHHFGGTDTAVFFDPPYLGFEQLYAASPVAKDVEAWCRDHADLRIALCGHHGDYDLDDWNTLEWSRGRCTYGGSETMDMECIWFSPACARPIPAQGLLF
jgi:hypothetical protein